MSIKSASTQQPSTTPAIPSTKTKRKRDEEKYACFLGISHYLLAIMILNAFNKGILLAMAARPVARRPYDIEWRHSGWGLSARRRSGERSCLLVLFCAA